MRLHYNVASPYARKVIAVAIETGLRERLELAPRKMSPVNPNAELNRDNPLGKIPCLVTDDGLALYDSRVVCEYLDGLHDGPKMFPPAGPARWTALRRQAEGDGILDAAVLTRYETVPQARGAPLAGVDRGPEGEVPPRARCAGWRGRELRRDRRHRHDHDRLRARLSRLPLRRRRLAPRPPQARRLVRRLREAPRDGRDRTAGGLVSRWA